MTNEQTPPMKLSREDLYELVWSKPIRDLAKDFGISDVALAKRCKRLGIPVPGRGSWARVDAGQKPYKPSLPKREPEWGDHNALTVPAASAAVDVENAPDAAAKDLSAPTDVIQANLAALTIAPTASILETLPAVKRTARELKHPRRFELTFDRGEKAGPVVPIEVSESALDRALLLADLLLRASESLGWAFVDVLPKSPEPQTQRYSYRQPEPPPPAKKEPRIGQLLVAGERVTFRIEERYRDQPRTPTDKELAREKVEYGYKAPRKETVATGNLRVVRLDTYGSWREPTRQSWYDRGNTPVESQLKDIMLGFHELAQSIKVRRADDERKRLEREDAERRQKEYEARQDANAKLIKQLETDAGAWHRARYLRRYIHAARRALAAETITGAPNARASIRVRFLKETVDFLDWAEVYVNQLDPLSPEPRAGEFLRNGSYHYVTDIDRIKAAFARLLGSDWYAAWKLGTDYTPAPIDPYSYREKSVFEVEASTED